MGELNIMAIPKKKCEWCNGDGMRDGDECEACDGLGEVSE
jgi:DnaJ-class molecular chaperone